MKIQLSPGDGLFLTGSLVAVAAMVLAYVIMTKPWIDTACLRANAPGGGQIEVCGPVVVAAPAPPAPAPPAPKEEEPTDTPSE